MGIDGTPTDLVGKKVTITYRNEYWFTSHAGGELLGGEHSAYRGSWTRLAAGADLAGLAVRIDLPPRHGGPYVTVVPFSRVLSVTAVA